MQASTGAKIHFISLDAQSDAILLESNGKYALIDSGEDWDAITPDNWTPDYPYRQGITQGIGYEQQVIHYLEKLGVTKLEFYLATHAHSDHIGSCDEVLRQFSVDKLYIKEYSETYSDSAALWDNQKVYDEAIAAAKETGTEIIYVNKADAEKTVVSW